MVAYFEFCTARRSSSSTASWATMLFHAGPWWRFGSGIVRPISRPATLSEKTNTSDWSTSPRERMASSTPHWRKISMVRAKQPRDFG